MKALILFILCLLFSSTLLESYAQRSKFRGFNFNKPKSVQSATPNQSSIFDVSSSRSSNEATVLPPISSRKLRVKPDADQSNIHGRSYAGKRIDQHGNNLGPSGVKQVNNVKFSSSKKAADAARNYRGSVTSESDKKDFHTHSVDKKGKRIHKAPHFLYPKRN